MTCVTKTPPCPSCQTPETVDKSEVDGSEWVCTECGERFDTPIQYLTDEVSIGKHTTSPKRLHIPEEDSDKPICRMASQGSFKTRSAESYPLYYHEMCGYCRNRINREFGV